ncbi:MAG: hypothetical protein C4308_07585 [Chitinophagaceae bacterium]
MHFFNHSHLPEAVKDELYLQLKIFISWKLNNDFYNRSSLRLPVNAIYFQPKFQRAHRYNGLQQKMKQIRLTLVQKRSIAGIMKAWLALQCKETDPMSYSNENADPF